MELIDFLKESGIDFTVSETGKITVGGYLDLQDTKITALPDGLTVGGYLYLSGTAITAKQVKSPPYDFLNHALKRKGQIVIDGIYAVLVQQRGDILRVRNFGSKDVLFAVKDGNGNWAHGKTLEDARNDLVFKATAKFDGKIPESAKVSEWIPIYRGITGACAAGVKHFVTSKGVSLDQVMTVKDVVNAVDGAYGSEKFKQKVKK